MLRGRWTRGEEVSGKREDERLFTFWAVSVLSLSRVEGVGTWIPEGGRWRGRRQPLRSGAQSGPVTSNKELPASSLEGRGRSSPSTAPQVPGAFCGTPGCSHRESGPCDNRQEVMVFVINETRKIRMVVASQDCPFLSPVLSHALLPQ